MAESFQDTQYAFAAHIRDPKNVPAPEGIEDRRMAIYRELFFNNLRSLLSSTYPVLKKLHEDAKWRQMVRGFMKVHQAKTPYFMQLPSEFLAFLQTEYEMQDDDFPFLLELAHYEYVELALSVSEAENDTEGVDPAGDLLAGIPVKSELAWVYAYNYAVHRINNEFIPEQPEPQPVYLAVFRRQDDKVKFMELNPVTAGLLNAMEQNSEGRTGEEILRQLASDFNFPEPDKFVEHGHAALQELQQSEIVIGARSPE